MKERAEEGPLNAEEAKQSQALWNDLVNGVFNPQTVLQTHFGHLGNDLNQEAVEKITQDFLQHASVGKSPSDIQKAARNLDAVINAAPFVSNNERAKFGATNASQASQGAEAVRAEQESDQAIKAKNAKNEAEANQITPTRDEPTVGTPAPPQKVGLLQRIRNGIQTVRGIASNAKESIDKKAKQAKVILFKKVGIGRDSVTPVETKPVEATLTSIDNAATTAKSQVDTASHDAQQRLEAMEVAFLDRLREKVEAISEARLTEGTPEFDQIIKEIEAEKNSAEPVRPSEQVQSQSLEEVDASIDAFVNEVHGNIDATEKSFTDNLLRELEDAEISDAEIDQLASELGEMPAGDLNDAILQEKGDPNKAMDEARKALDELSEKSNTGEVKTIEKSTAQMLADLDKALDMMDEPAKASAAGGPKAEGPAKLDVPTIPSPRGSH